MRPLFLPTLLSLCIIFGSGCATVPAKKDESLTSIDTSNKISFLYKDLFQRDAAPQWKDIRVQNFSISIPYSSAWTVLGFGLSPYDTDSTSTDPDQIQTTSFGKPMDVGTYGTREYWIYRTNKIPLGLTYTEHVSPLKDILTCVDGFAAQIKEIAGVSGIEHHMGGAKGCATGFAFNVGEHTYYLYRVPDIGDPAPEINDEMMRIIKSIKE